MEIDLQQTQRKVQFVQVCYKYEKHSDRHLYQFEVVRWCADQKSDPNRFNGRHFSQAITTVQLVHMYGVNRVVVLSVVWYSDDQVGQSYTIAISDRLRRNRAAAGGITQYNDNSSTRTHLHMCANVHMYTCMHRETEVNM